MSSKNLFFGDSLTSAENNNFNGFVEKLNLDRFINYGVSGTTIGDYSLYPVGPTDLLSTIRQHEDEIKSADKIFLEYGSNDISSIMTEYINSNRMYFDLIKALDYLKQLTCNKADIYFILLDDKNAQLMAKGQLNYLSNYFKEFIMMFTPKGWFNEYHKLKTNIKNIFKEKAIEVDCDLTNYISEDGIHPNDIGYQLIADCIKNKVKELE